MITTPYRPTLITPECFTPYRWQLSLAYHLLERGHLACAAAPGAGKTHAALLAAQAIGASTILVVAPPGRVCRQWQAAAQAWGATATIVGGPSAGGITMLAAMHAALPPYFQPDQAPAVCILPWSRLARAADAEALDGIASAAMTGTGRTLADLLILDESHKAQSAEETQTGRSTIGYYCKKNRYRKPGILALARSHLALSGTPSTSDPKKLRVQLLVAKVDQIEKAKELESKYKYEAAWWGGHMQYVRAAGRELWMTTPEPRPGHAALLKDSVLIVSSEDLARQLPPFRRELLPDMQSGPTIPDTMRHALEAWAGALAQGVTSAIPSLAEIADLRRQATEDRCDDIAAWVQEWSEEEAEGRVLMVLCVYQESCDRIANAIRIALPEHQVAACHGGMSAGNRTAAITSAMAGQVRAIVATHATIGTGIDGLQHRSDTMLFAEVPWTPGDCEQSEGRLLRTGQKRPVRSVWVTAGIEGAIARGVGGKAHSLYGVLVSAARA
jgi:superfamily II DNA or RNA helicase